MFSISSYPKIYQIGHAAIKELFLDNVLIEEKIDGSSISFCVNNGTLFMRSKSADIDINDSEKMFNHAVTTCKELVPLLKEGWIYRGEYLQKPKHNVLAYDRIPNKHIIIYDIMIGPETYLSYPDKVLEAQRLGLEVVPFIHVGKVHNPNDLLQLLEITSILGGQKIEGVVVKNYNRFGPDKKILIGKYVSEHFKEVHKGIWGEKDKQDSHNDIVMKLISKYKTVARWDKAIIHLKERGLIENSSKDIGLLMKEINIDLLSECKDEIKEDLFNFFWKKVSSKLTSGFPEYYKNKLLENQFENKE